MLYGNLDVHHAIMRRVGRIHREKTSPLDTEIIVDRAHHERGTCSHQRPLLRELVARKVLVLLSTGESDQGVLHTKMVVVDNRIVYIGSANVTFGATNNREGVV